MKPAVLLTICAVLAAGCSAEDRTSATDAVDGGRTSTAGSAAPKPVSTPPGSLQPTETSSALLDEASVRWFETFCFGLTPLVAAADGPPTGATDAGGTAARQAARVSQLREIGTAFTDTAADLESLPSPTIPDAERFVSNVVTGLRDGGAALTTGADEYAVVDAADPAALAAAEGAVAADFQAAAASLGVASELPPAVQSSLQNIPPCKALSN